MLTQFYFKQITKLNSSKIYREFWVFCAIYLLLSYGIFAAYFFSLGKWQVPILATLAGLFTRYVVCEIFYFFHKKQHPYQRLNFTPPRSWLFSLVDAKPDAFPSQHASTMAAVSMVFLLFNLKLGIASMLVAAVTALARVVIGYHDFIDVIAGLIVGCTAGALVYFIWVNWLFTR